MAHIILSRPVISLWLSRVAQSRRRRKLQCRRVVFSVVVVFDHDVADAESDVGGGVNRRDGNLVDIFRDEMEAIRRMHPIPTSDTNRHLPIHIFSKFLASATNSTVCVREERDLDRSMDLNVVE
ncbi:hypothetical protein AAHA92_03743 [Salvia divinorum]|uniref:Uncharacterized protein n=1 Tax=Salvia divinorum TaxID=28513 RepID=A0ABD1IIU2_SALDI